MLMGVVLDGTHVDCSTSRCRIVDSTMKPGQVALLTFVLCYALIIYEGMYCFVLSKLLNNFVRL